MLLSALSKKTFGLSSPLSPNSLVVVALVLAISREVGGDGALVAAVPSRSPCPYYYMKVPPPKDDTQVASAAAAAAILEPSVAARRLMLRFLKPRNHKLLLNFFTIY